MHDLGVRSEGVVGFTSEQVFALDDDSHVVVRAVSYDDEGAGRATFSKVESPVTGAVQTVALSSDGRYLAWTGLDDASHRYDLKAGHEDLASPGDSSTGVVDVSADGLLLYTPDGLVLRDGATPRSRSRAAHAAGARPPRSPRDRCSSTVATAGPGCTTCPGALRARLRPWTGSASWRRTPTGSVS